MTYEKGAVTMNNLKLIPTLVILFYTVFSQA